jgi:hypothetical protein
MLSLTSSLIFLGSELNSCSFMIGRLSNKGGSTGLIPYQVKRISGPCGLPSKFCLLNSRALYRIGTSICLRNQFTNPFWTFRRRIRFVSTRSLRSLASSFSGTKPAGIYFLTNAGFAFSNPCLSCSFHIMSRISRSSLSV